MKKFNLRPVDAAASALQRGVMAWQEREMPIRYRGPGTVNEPHPRAMSSYIAFHASDAHGGWDGLIRSDEWLSNAAPALASLASACAGGDHAAHLFAATPRPFSGTLPAVFAYTAIEVTGTVPGRDLQDAPLAALTAPEGTIWLRALPSLPPQEQEQEWEQTPAAPGIAAWICAIPVSLQFLLGSSRLSRGCLSRVGPGDVLLVSEHALRIRCQDLVLGLYSINEEGINVDELLNEPYNEPYGECTDADEIALVPGQEPGRDGAGMARIPVRLEFVLQQKTMTVGELGRLHRGQVIGLAPLAEKEVLILANGVALGRGELVQMEGRLGVEMSDIYGSPDHAH